MKEKGERKESGTNVVESRKEDRHLLPHSSAIVSKKWTLEIKGDVAIVTSSVSPRVCDCGGMCCGCLGIELKELCRPLTARVVILDMGGIDMTYVVRPDLQILEAAIRETRRAKQRGANAGRAWDPT